MRPSEACYALIKHFEGCKLTAYPDPGTGGSPWTIGYGHTGAEVHPGLTITQAFADAYLLKDLQHAVDATDAAVTLAAPMFKQGMFDACVSLAFNIGPGGPRRHGIFKLRTGMPSTFLRKLNAGDTLGAAQAILAWNRSGGNVMAGLVRRRAAEQSLFLS